jgi:hypothetical protein
MSSANMNEDKKEMTYTEQAAKRAFCRRLTSFIRLIDYLVATTLQSLTVSSTAALRDYIHSIIKRAADIEAAHLKKLAEEEAAAAAAAEAAAQAAAAQQHGHGHGQAAPAPPAQAHPTPTKAKQAPPEAVETVTPLFKVRFLQNS